MKSGLVFPRNSINNLYTAQGLPQLYKELFINAFAIYYFDERTGGYIYNLVGTSGTDGSILTGDASGSNDTFQQMWDNGIPGGIDFDGTNDEINLGSGAIWKWMHGAENTSAFKLTISMWVQLKNVNPNNIYVFLDNCGAGSANKGIFIAFDDRASVPRNRCFIFAIYRGQTGVPVIIHLANEKYPDDTEPHHIVYTYDQALASSNSNIYVDSELVSTANKTANVPSTANASFDLGFGGYTMATTGPANMKAYSLIFCKDVWSQYQITRIYEYEKKYMKI